MMKQLFTRRGDFDGFQATELSWILAQAPRVMVELASAFGA
jgi:hypothetical protein